MSRALFLNGATVMTTPTPRQLEVARAAGYQGIEARAERLLAFEFLGFGDCPINTPALAAETVLGVDGVDLALDSCH